MAEALQRNFGQRCRGIEFGQIRQCRLSDDVVTWLEAMVLEDMLEPDERLPVKRMLTERFGVFRPPLREAIQKLVAGGLLVSRQGGGNCVTGSLGAAFSDPLLHLLEDNPGAQRDLLGLRRTLEGSCAYYAALRAISLGHQRLTEAFKALQTCYARNNQVSTKEGAVDARFYLAIVGTSHNTVSLHTIRGLFDLLWRSVATDIGGMYAQHTETRAQLVEQHQRLYGVIIGDQVELAWEVPNQRIHCAQEVLMEVQGEVRGMERSQRRYSVQEDQRDAGREAFSRPHRGARRAGSPDRSRALSRYGAC